MTKYYRVLKDTFLWEKGAIISNENTEDHVGYTPIEDIWNKFTDQNEYISAPYIEQSPQWFERVYATNLEKLIFKTAGQLKKALNFVK